MARAGRAGAHAGGHAVFFGQVFVVNPINAQRTFLHHTRVLIQLARAVGTGPCAQATADAFVLIHQHNPIFFAFVTGPGWADGYARCVFAMQAGFREMHGLCRAFLWRDLIAEHAVQERPGGIRAVRVHIRQWRAIILCVPPLTGGHAAMAADTGIKVDHQAEFLLLCAGQTGHQIFLATLAGPLPTGDVIGGCAGWLSAGLGSAFFSFTRRSNHAACPVIGSELAHLMPSPLGG